MEDDMRAGPRVPTESLTLGQRVKNVPGKACHGATIPFPQADRVHFSLPSDWEKESGGMVGIIVSGFAVCLTRAETQSIGQQAGQPDVCNCTRRRSGRETGETLSTLVWRAYVPQLGEGRPVAVRCQVRVRGVVLYDCRRLTAVPRRACYLGSGRTRGLRNRTDGLIRGV